MTNVPRKRPRGKRCEPPALEHVDAEFGPMMKALPSDRHRAFIQALYQLKPGYGAATRAARLAGFGTATSSADSMAVIGHRLMHDERILRAVAEEDQKRIRATAPRAIRALEALIEDPKSKDHARGIAMVLDRVHPAEAISTVRLTHDVTPEFRSTAEVMARIAELSAKFGIGAKVIDHE